VTRSDTIHFPGINGLRFLAALAVIITHTELMKGVFGLEDAWHHPLINNLGGLGVYFFFVLSGFLITFLLLTEKTTFGAINIGQFYLRRILRIWPLYYVIVILGFFVLPHFTSINIPYLEKDFHEHFGTDLGLYVFILPNLAFSMFRAVPHIGQVWSIGVEEQFYIFWPLLVSRSRNLMRTLLILLGIIIATKICVLLLGFVFGSEKWYQTLKAFVAMSKFECMAVGGIGAWLLQNNKTRFLRLIHHHLIFIICIILIPILMIFTPDFLQDGIHLVYSILFLVIIMNVAAGAKKMIDLENPVMSYLGKISYGIYMYHFMIIPVVIRVLMSMEIMTSGIQFNIILYVAVIVLTITVSSISYYILEKRFIHFKHRFARIHSTGEKNSKLE
jgi:peptidoglycan/LPS O-acetylase OafA/YrhL